MKRIVMLATFGVAGCSNAPLAGFLDTVAPCKAGADDPMQRRPQPGPGVNISPTDLPPASRPTDRTLPPPAEVVPPVGPR